MSNHAYEDSKYPEWPISFKGHFPSGKESVELLGSNIPLPDLSGGPDPIEVNNWKTSNMATVSQVCEHFGLSRVQVIKAAGI